MNMTLRANSGLMNAIRKSVGMSSIPSKHPKVVTLKDRVYISLSTAKILPKSKRDKCLIIYTKHTHAAIMIR